eukprot:2737420-Amphidinium_carterae.1
MVVDGLSRWTMQVQRSQTCMHGKMHPGRSTERLATAIRQGEQRASRYGVHRISQALQSFPRPQSPAHATAHANNDFRIPVKVFSTGQPLYLPGQQTGLDLSEASRSFCPRSHPFVLMGMLVGSSTAPAGSYHTRRAPDRAQVCIRCRESDRLLFRMQSALVRRFRVANNSATEVVLSWQIFKQRKSETPMPK